MVVFTLCMAKFVIVNANGLECTEPIPDKDRAEELLERKQENGAVGYSLKRIGRGFN